MSAAKPWLAKQIKETGLIRIGQPWSNDEETELLNLLKENKTIGEISTILQRAEGGIKARIKIMVYRMKDEKSKDELMEMFKLDLNTVTKYTKEKVERKKKVKSNDDKDKSYDRADNKRNSNLDKADNKNNTAKSDELYDFGEDENVIKLLKAEFAEMKTCLRKFIEKYKSIESILEKL